MFSRKNVREFLIITVGTIIIAAAVYFFMLPSHVTVGSGAALAMVISNFVPLPVSQITLLLNIFLLIIGFLLIGPEFGIKTVYCAILMPAVMGVSMKPGAMALQVTLRLASSRAMVLVRPTTPALEAE